MYYSRSMICGRRFNKNEGERAGRGEGETRNLTTEGRKSRESGEVTQFHDSRSGKNSPDRSGQAVHNSVKLRVLRGEEEPRMIHRL